MSRLDAAGPSERLVDTGSGYQPGKSFRSDFRQGFFVHQASTDCPFLGPIAWSPICDINSSTCSIKFCKSEIPATHFFYKHVLQSGYKTKFIFLFIHFHPFQEGLKSDRIPTFPFPQLSPTLMNFHPIFHSTQFLIQTKCRLTPFHPTHISLSPIHPNLTTRTVTPQAPPL